MIAGRSNQSGRFTSAADGDVLNDRARLVEKVRRAHAELRDAQAQATPRAIQRRVDDAFAKAEAEVLEHQRAGDPDAARTAIENAHHQLQRTGLILRTDVEGNSRWSDPVSAAGERAAQERLADAQAALWGFSEQQLDQLHGALLAACTTQLEAAHESVEQLRSAVGEITQVERTWREVCDSAGLPRNGIGNGSEPLQAALRALGVPAREARQRGEPFTEHVIPAEVPQAPTPPVGEPHVPPPLDPDAPARPLDPNAFDPPTLPARQYGSPGETWAQRHGGRAIAEE